MDKEIVVEQEKEYASNCMYCKAFVRWKRVADYLYPEGGRITDAICESCYQNMASEIENEAAP